MFRRLFLPSLFSAFGLAFADMADALVVGQRMGATGLAAISLSLPVYMIINLFMHGFGGGGSVRYSKLLGEGRKDDAVRSFNRVAQAALAVSIVMAVLGNLFLEPLLSVLGAAPENQELYNASREYVQIIVCGIPLFFFAYILNYYLRNDDNQRLASVAFIIGNAVDIGLNILFVLVLDLGVKGAAYSTLIGYAVSICCYLPGLFSKKHTLRVRTVRPGIREAFSCFATGFSTSSQYLMQMLFFIIVNNTLLRMMNGSESGVAVFDMLQNASYLVLYLYDAAAKAAQPLASTYCGEQNRQGERNTLRYALIFGSLAGAAMALLLCLFPHTICALFGLGEASLIAMATPALRIYCGGLLLAGVSIILESYFQSCDREKAAFALTLLRGAVILLPVTLLFSLCFPIALFWWLFPVTEALTLLLFFVLLPRFKRKALPAERILERTIKNKNEDLGDLTQAAEVFCEQWEATPKQTYFVTMTIEEICLAIMLNAFDQTENGFIQMTLVALPDGLFELHLRDNATAFDPFSLVTEGAGFNIDAAGMTVIKNKAKDFFYRRYQGFNALVVRI